MRVVTTDGAAMAARGLWADGTALQDALGAVLGGARGAHVAVALWSGSRMTTATIGGADEPVTVGCLAKLLTATLARRAVSDGRLALDRDLGTFFGATPALPDGLTLRRLLEHTHGLDDSLLEPPVRGAYVDTREFLDRVVRLPRLAPPGALYSYGNLGAWLVAAALERVFGRPYADLVGVQILEPLAIRADVAASFCAATGSGLALSAAQLAELAAAASAKVDQWPGEGVAGSRGAITPLPGWNPLERGVYLGWKYAGSGWFGHQSTWPGASALLRVHPVRRCGLVVVSRAHAAAVIAHRLFAREVPELFGFGASARGQPAGSDRQWVGRYERAALAVDITATDGGLSADVRPRVRHGGHVAGAKLHATAGGVWFAEPASEALPFAQFLSDAAGHAWLWNGRFILKRLVADPRPSGTR